MGILDLRRDRLPAGLDGFPHRSGKQHEHRDEGGMTASHSNVMSWK